MKLKATPPKPGTTHSLDRDQRISEVVSGATAMPGSETPPVRDRTPARPTPVLPWRSDRVRADRVVQLNVRIPEPLSVKLNHVAHMTDTRLQELVAEALAPLVDAKLLEIGYSEEDI